MWMQVAEVIAMRSTCERANVGAVIVHNNDLVCVGYNGPPSGEPHCKGNACEISETGGCLRSVHAETNAVERAHDKLGALHDCQLYCTYSPCLFCAMRIVGAGISRFYYRYSYRDLVGLQYIRSHCLVYRITPAGYIIEDSTGEFVNA
jgi:dCMP deaminase